MQNDILDQPDKHAGPRTCPDCGHRLPLSDFVRLYVRSYGTVSKWLCRGCRATLKSDFSTIQFYWLLGLVPFGGLFGFLIGTFDLGLFNVIYLVPYFTFVLLTFHYLKFEIET